MTTPMYWCSTSVAHPSEKRSRSRVSTGLRWGPRDPSPIPDAIHHRYPGEGLRLGRGGKVSVRPFARLFDPMSEQVSVEPRRQVSRIYHEPGLWIAAAPWQSIAEATHADLARMREVVVKARIGASGSADRVVEAAGIRVIKTPIAAPKANAHMERQIGSGRRECFDWMLILGRRHLERVMQEWIAHYNEARPHRGLDLRTPIARSDPVDATAAVDFRTRSGGLLREYSRQSAQQAA